MGESGHCSEPSYKWLIKEVSKEPKNIEGTLCLTVFCVYSGSVLGTNYPAETRRLCNVRLTLDMTSDRRCILVENENRVDVNI